MVLHHKFPRTPHVFWLSKQPLRDDKLLTPAQAEALLSETLIIEEKVDGANLGFSLSEQGALQVQNRGNYLSGALTGQFAPLRDWMGTRMWPLQEALGPNLIIFGEWCYARHSVSYSRLPDWFLGFDVYDRETGNFFSTAKRNSLLGQIPVHPVRTVAQGRFSRKELIELLREPSAYTGENMEGLYLRQESNEVLTSRAKLVNPDFVSNITRHWSQGELVRNCVAVESGTR